MILMRLSKQFSLSLVLIASLISACFAANEDKRGFDIAARSDRTDLGFGDSDVELKMILQNAAGKSATRKLSIKTLEKENEDVGDKSLIIFESPADVDGTALLSHSKILEPDNQWLYLPALKRIKRISSANKSGPFLGSEFAFEDFTALELNKFTYKYIGSEKCGQLICDVVERYPRYEYSGYSKQRVWIDQTRYLLRKLDFYDRREDLLKTLLLTDYRIYLNKFWRAHSMSMINHQTKKKTTLVYSLYKFKQDLNKRLFTKSALNRIR